MFEKVMNIVKRRCSRIGHETKTKSNLNHENWHRFSRETCWLLSLRDRFLLQQLSYFLKESASLYYFCAEPHLIVTMFLIVVVTTISSLVAVLRKHPRGHEFASRRCGQPERDWSASTRVRRRAIEVLTLGTPCWVVVQSLQDAEAEGRGRSETCRCSDERRSTQCHVGNLE